MLPGWSDSDVLDCDFGRLLIAIKAAVKRIDEDRTFQMALHDKKPKPAYEPPKNQIEQIERTKATFASLGTTIITDDG